MIGLSDQPPYQLDIKKRRDRAEEARVQAEQLTDPVCRRMMTQIAEAYERMIDWQLATNRLLRSLIPDRYASVNEITTSRTSRPRPLRSRQP